MVIRIFKEYLTKKDKEIMEESIKKYNSEVIKTDKAKADYTNQERYCNSIVFNSLTDKEKAKEIQKLKDLENQYKAYADNLKIISEQLDKKQDALTNKAVNSYIDKLKGLNDYDIIEDKILEDTKRALNSITKKAYESWCNQNTVNVNGKEYRFTNKNGEIKQIENESQEELIANYLTFELNAQLSAFNYFAFEDDSIINLVNLKAEELTGTNNYRYTLTNNEIKALNTHALQPKEENKRIYKIGDLEIRYRNPIVIGKKEKKEKPKENELIFMADYNLAADTFAKYCFTELAKKIGEPNYDRRLGININQYAEIMGRKIETLTQVREVRKEIEKHLETLTSLVFAIRIKDEDGYFKEDKIALCDRATLSTEESDNNYAIYFSQSFIDKCRDKKHTQGQTLPNSYFTLSNRNQITKAFMNKLYDYYLIPNNIANGTNNKIKLANLISAYPNFETKNNLRHWKNKIAEPTDNALIQLTKINRGLTDYSYVLEGRENKLVGKSLLDVLDNMPKLTYSEWKENIYLLFEIRESKELKAKNLENKEKAKKKAEEQKKNKEKAKDKKIKENIKKKADKEKAN